MKRMDLIGIDLGLLSQVGERAGAAAEIGARLVRLRFSLGGSSEVGPAFVADARAAVAALAAKGLKVLAVIDSDLTVAPDGMGAFVDRPQGPLARAWVEEMQANAADLARALAGSVAAWELLPLPNAGAAPRIQAGRWVALMDGLAAQIRAADPEASIVSGALLSDDRDDGTAYLEAALSSAGGRLPVDVLGLRLAIMAGGSPSDAILAAGLRDRVERLLALLRRHAGEAVELPEIWVTSLGWDAQTVGELNQASMAWTALSALSAQPRVGAVVWCGLTDDNPSSGGMACGLFQGSTALGNQRRAAGNAFRDFSTYVRQISMPAAAAALLREDEPAPAAPAPAPSESPIGDETAPQADIVQELDPQRPERVEESGGWTTAGVAGAAALATLEPLSDRERRQPTEATPLPWASEQAEDEAEAAPAVANSDEGAVLPDGGAAASAMPEDPGAAAPVSDVASITDAPAAAADATDTDTTTAASRGLSGLADAAAAAMAATAAGIAGLFRSIGHDDDESPAPPPPAPPAPAAPEAAPLPSAGAETTIEDLVPVAAPITEAIAAPADAALAAPAAAAPGTIRFHLPNAREVLTSQGFEGEGLEAILEAVRRRYGSYQWLPAGDYEVELPVAEVEPTPTADVATEPVAEVEPTPMEAVASEPVVEVLPTPAEVVASEPVAEVEPTPAEVVASEPVVEVQPTPVEAIASEPVVEVLPPPTEVVPATAPAPLPAVPARPAVVLSNQMMISALYRAGGGAWGLFDRAGLSLRDLAARRTQPYSGPAVSAMSGLSPEEQAAVQRELDSVIG